MRELRGVILASASPRRAEILRSMGLRVEIIPSGYDEPEVPGLAPAVLARHHARAKAHDVFRRVPGRTVVAGDTVVDVDGVALGKPRTPEEASEMLRALSGRAHDVHSAFVVIDEMPSRTLERCSTTRVWFHPLDEAEIAAYVASGEPMDKAGAYGIQGRGATLVERIDGDFYTVMGFPLALFARTLRTAFGLTLPFGATLSPTAPPTPTTAGDRR